MSEITNDNQQPSLLPETGGLPVLQSGGEIVPAVPGSAAKDECAPAALVLQDAAYVRPDDNQTDIARKELRIIQPIGRASRFWNADNTAEAIRLWDAGKSGGEIGFLLGTTRDAIIGKLHRMGLLGNPLRVKPIRSARDPFRRSPKTPRIPQIIVPIEPPDLSMVLNILNTTAFDRRCRYPLWDQNEQSEFIFCGHKVALETTSYCAFHHSLCHGEGTKSERRADSIISYAAHVSANVKPDLVADIAEEAVAV